MIEATIEDGQIWPYDIDDKPEGYVYFPNFEIPKLYKDAWIKIMHPDLSVKDQGYKIMVTAFANEINFDIRSLDDLRTLRNRFFKTIASVKSYNDIMRRHNEDSGTRYLKSKEL